MSVLIMSVLIPFAERHSADYQVRAVASQQIKTRTQVKKADKRDRIRAAAASLFHELGYDGATTRAIALRAGVAHGTLFLYARDKDEALALVYEDDVRLMLEARVSTIPARAGTRARIVHIASGLFDLYAAYPALARRFVERIPRIDETRREAHDALNAQIEALIRAELVRGASSGELRARIDIGVATSNVFAIMRVHIFRWLSQPPCHVDVGVASFNSALRQLLEGIVAKAV